jgi:hypothetical protein
MRKGQYSGFSASFVFPIEWTSFFFNLAAHVGQAQALIFIK